MKGSMTICVGCLLSNDGNTRLCAACIRKLYASYNNLERELHRGGDVALKLANCLSIYIHVCIRFSSVPGVHVLLGHTSVSMALLYVTRICLSLPPASPHCIVRLVRRFAVANWRTVRFGPVLSHNGQATVATGSNPRPRWARSSSARARACIPNNEDSDKSTRRIRPRMYAEYPMHNIASLSARRYLPISYLAMSTTHCRVYTERCSVFSYYS